MSNRETFFDFVARVGERPAAKALGISYSKLRRAHAGETRPSPRVLDVAEAHGLDREASLVEWDTRHKHYLDSPLHKQSMARNDAARARRKTLEAEGREGCLGHRVVPIGVEGSTTTKAFVIHRAFAFRSVPEGRLWCYAEPGRRLYAVRLPWPSDAVRKGLQDALIRAVVAEPNLVTTSEDKRRVRVRERNAVAL